MIAVYYSLGWRRIMGRATKEPLFAWRDGVVVHCSNTRGGGGGRALLREELPKRRGEKGLSSVFGLGRRRQGKRRGARRGLPSRSRRPRGAMFACVWQHYRQAGGGRLGGGGESAVRPPAPGPGEPRLIHSSFQPLQQKYRIGKSTLTACSLAYSLLIYLLLLKSFSNHTEWSK